MAWTTASERRAKREQGVEILFPEYEDWVSIRPMDEAFFLRHGMIPDFLAPAINKIIAEGQGELPKVEKNDEWLAWLDELVKFCFVHPKVVDNPQGDDEISIDDVSYQDKCFLYSLFGQPANVLRRFRDKQKQLVAAVDVTKNNGHLTEPVSAHTAMGN